MYTFIDTHCHFNDASFASDAADAIQRAVDAGVGIMLQADIDSSERESMFALVDSHSGHLRPMLGLYPGSVRSNWMDEIDALSPWKSRSDIVAIGEIGLDYYYDLSEREVQKSAFAKQIEHANQAELPIALHVRDAYEDTRKILFDMKGYIKNGLLLHCYSGSSEYVKIFDKLDAYYAFSGAITFKNAKHNLESLAVVPKGRLLLETDCPYMTPVPFRGKTNEPKYVSLVAQKAAQVLGMSVEEIEEITTQNAKRLFTRMK